jgi:hypothetical protein
MGAMHLFLRLVLLGTIMSASMYNVSSTVWCPPAYITYALLCNVLSAYLHDVCLPVWCLPYWNCKNSISTCLRSSHNLLFQLCEMLLSFLLFFFKQAKFGETTVPFALFRILRNIFCETRKPYSHSLACFLFRVIIRNESSHVFLFHDTSIERLAGL